MDPQAAMAQLRAAITESDWERANSAASALCGWLCRGGYVPSVDRRQLLALLLCAESHSAQRTKQRECPCQNS